jgi:glycerophosphoryl diester phosphodiesterase
MTNQRLKINMKYSYIYGFMMLFSCNSNVQIDVQGHRGCRGLFPENSIPAFQKAIDLGVTTLELDVVISKDKKVVVSHDPFMNHEIALDIHGNEISEAAEKSFNLYAMTYDSIKAYDCGSKVHKRFPNQQKLNVYKPLLEEVIDLSEIQSKNKSYYNIEIKSLPEWDNLFTPSVTEFVALVLEIVSSKNIADRTILQSFDVRALEEIKKQSPQIKTALLVDEDESILEKLQTLNYKPEIISPYFKLIDASVVKNLQNEGYKVIPWTVNDDKDIIQMISFKVDGIISDFPDKVLKLIL